MNVLLWVLQVVLALLCVAGGAYKITSFDQIAAQLAPLSRAGAGALGVLEIVCGLLLIVPGAFRRMPALTTLAAVVLAVENLGLSGLNASRSLVLAPTNPLVWTAGIAVVAAFIAYGRYALKPLR